MSSGKFVSWKKIINFLGLERKKGTNKGKKKIEKFLPPLKFVKNRVARFEVLET